MDDHRDPHLSQRFCFLAQRYNEIRRPLLVAKVNRDRVTICAGRQRQPVLARIPIPVWKLNRQYVEDAFPRLPMMADDSASLLIPFHPQDLLTRETLVANAASPTTQIYRGWTTASPRTILVTSEMRERFYFLKFRQNWFGRHDDFSPRTMTMVSELTKYLGEREVPIYPERGTYLKLAHGSLAWIERLMPRGKGFVCTHLVPISSLLDPDFYTETVEGLWLKSFAEPWTLNVAHLLAELICDSLTDHHRHFEIHSQNIDLAVDKELHSFKIYLKDLSDGAWDPLGALVEGNIEALRLSTLSRLFLNELPKENIEGDDLIFDWPSIRSWYDLSLGWAKSFALEDYEQATGRECRSAFLGRLEASVATILQRRMPLDLSRSSYKASRTIGVSDFISTAHELLVRHRFGLLLADGSIRPKLMNLTEFLGRGKRIVVTSRLYDMASEGRTVQSGPFIRPVGLMGVRALASSVEAVLQFGSLFGFDIAYSLTPDGVPEHIFLALPSARPTA